jgi:hypothetical protein
VVRGRSRRWIAALALLALAPLLYCALAEPPAEIRYPVPLAAGELEALTAEWWRLFHAHDSGAVRSAACRVAHAPLPGAPALADAEAGLPPVGAPPPAAQGDDLLCRLEAAVERHPDDPLLPTVLGAAYLWRAQVRADPGSMDHDLHEARHHAGQGVRNGNPLAGGFEAAPTFMLGFLTGDDALKRKGYDQLVGDTLEFAAFHGYIEGALMAAMLDPEKDQGFDYDWAIVSIMENLETCLVGSRLRGVFRLPEGLVMNRFIFNAVAAIASISGRGYCYNNSTAPFNMQGMYVTQGDAYLKNGDLELARIAYRNALASPNAASWPYRDQVEIRLADLEGTRRKFLADSGRMDISEEPTAMVVQSSWYCGSCHYAAHVEGRAPWEAGAAGE